MKKKTQKVSMLLLTTIVGKKDAETLPEQIEINGTVLKISETPELKSLIVAAQKVEKNKLYQTIEEQKVALEESKKENARLLELANTQNPVHVQVQPNSPHNGNQQPATPTKEGLKDPLSEVNKGTEMNQDAIKQVILNMFNENIPSLLKEYITPVIQKQQEIEAKRVDDFRVKRLQELGDTVIPELVSGSNESEIEQSIIVAKAARDRYNVQTPAPVTPAAGTASPVIETPVTPQVVVVPETPRYITPEEQVVNIKGLSDEDFAKKRDELFKKLPTQGGYAGQQ